MAKPIPISLRRGKQKVDEQLRNTSARIEWLTVQNLNMIMQKDNK